ncbi:MAG: mechanosensitive ion channel family protein [Akkermansiaceae bacterium]
MNDKSWQDWISNFFFKEPVYDLLGIWGQLLVSGLLFVGLVLLALVAYFFVHKVLIEVFNKLVKLTKNEWDDALMSSRIFKWLAMLVPVVLFWHLSPYVFDESSKVGAVGAVIRVISEILLVVLTLLMINSILNVIERIYQNFEVSRELPIKSFFQVIKIVLTLVGIIFIIATILGKSPLLLFSGLGAMTAIMMLVFKDSILGFVAGIQLSANKLVARGDWIEMPKFGADGEVLEVALTTVKVRNWDKTITTIPTYSLIADSFKNWRGMSQSGVRRIKRSLFLDMGTVKFLDDAMLEKLKKVSLLDKYLEKKELEIEKWNVDRKVANDDLINARAMTNVGTFRAYVNEYLKSHPKISQSDTILVRLLQASEHGLPLEVYVFTNDNNWIEYERIQSDIFDHLLAILAEFGLRVFQSPSGADVLSLGAGGFKNNEV